jgi:hypothetical protein
MNLWSRPKQIPDGAKLRVDRRERRYTVPVFSVRIMAELITPTATHHGVLWDISTCGACIQTYEVIPIGMSCTVRLHQHAGSQVVERQARLLWSDDVMRAHYVGRSFDEPIPVDSSTFLGVLIENSRVSQESPD